MAATANDSSTPYQCSCTGQASQATIAHTVAITAATQYHHTGTLLYAGCVLRGVFGVRVASAYRPDDLKAIRSSSRFSSASQTKREVIEAKQRPKVFSA